MFSLLLKDLISDFYCTIEYIAGTTNTCADLLSKHLDNVKKISDDQNCEEVIDRPLYQ